MGFKRKYPFGAEVSDDGVDFAVWVQNAEHVDLVLDEQVYPMEEKEDVFRCFVKGAKSGARYLFRFNGLDLPDPASRRQPEGIFGKSEVIDTERFKWNDQEWKGLSSIQAQVFYEFHVGTFTQEGTWNAARQKLAHLADLGVTVLEMMPIAEFYGNFGWGYDGIFLFAPYHKYGTLEDLKAFIEEAHRLKLGVILDVVYNHFGPDVDYHRKFAGDYFHHENVTEWGNALNFDGPNSSFVRSFVTSNVRYWVEEYHFDGIRLDATQQMCDTSQKSILAEIAEIAKEKKIVVIAENECQDIRLIKEYGLHGVWNDDFHHSVRVALTGDNEAYYKDYHGSPQEILAALKYGFLYQGQYYSWQSQRRGTASLDIPYHNFVIYLENHDQVANSIKSLPLRQLTHPALYRALTTLFLLAPQTPLLFQGQEFGSSTPFYFFADHDPEMGKNVWVGRRDFMSQWPSFKSLDLDPGSEQTFLNSKLHWEKKDEDLLALYREVLALRKKDATFTHPLRIDGALLTPEILLVRYFGKEEERLILCNFGHNYTMRSVSEPLFAPPRKKIWKLLFSSQKEHPAVLQEEWIFPAYCTYVLRPGVV